MKYWKYNRLKVALLLLLTGVFSGCVSDDTSGCIGQAYLHFEYTHNASLKNLLTEQVEYVNLFFYDEQGNLNTSRCVHIQDLDANGGIRLEVPPGDYTLIAWGNNDENKFELRDVSTLNGLRLSLLEDRDGYASNIPTLFYGGALFSASATYPVENRLSLIKNTNHIRFVLVDVTPVVSRVPIQPAIQGTDFRVRLLGCNWLYNYENNLDAAARGHKMEYKPANCINTDNQPQTEFDILRMFSDNSCQLEFVIEDVRYPNAEPIKRKWLTSKILETIPDVKNDSDLDRYDEYVIRVELRQYNQTWVVVRMFINDWEIKEFEGGI